MENTGQPSTGNQQLTRSRKKRKKGTIKPSNLNLRLDPNFDLIHSILSSNGFNNTEKYIQTKNQEELNPKTMDFDTLVTFLHPTFILDYLQRTLRFLRSDQKELCFPSFAPYKEEFLLRIAQDNRHLKCNLFSQASQTVAREILNILEAKKNVMKWTYNYDTGSTSMPANVLVYRKVSLGETQNVQNRNDLIQGNSTPKALDPSLQSVTLNRQDITAAFKIQTLNTVLKFIKDSTRSILKYTNLPHHEAAYVYFLIQSCYQGDTNIGFGFKSLLSPISEAMRWQSEWLEFRVNFFETNNKLANVVLQKIPKNATGAAAYGKTCQDLNSSTISTSTISSETSNLTKFQRDLISKQRLLTSIPEQTLRVALDELLDFILDSERAALDFVGITTTYSRFLQQMTSFARTTEYHKCFSEECVLRLKRIARAYTRKEWKLYVEVGKINKQTLLRNLSLHKVPMDAKKNQKPTTLWSATKNTSSSETTNLGNTQNTSTLKTVQVTVTNQRAPPLKKAIAFQSAGAHVLDSMETDPQNGASQFTGNLRKDRLIEAMCTPIESEWAAEQMRRMGWEGGPLGARGEGIVEPIMPALHLKPGAGLGHEITKPPIPIAQSRVMFLQSLLSLLQSGESETQISLEPLSKKKVRFVTHMVTSLNNGLNCDLKKKQEVDLYKELDNIMDKNPELYIDLGITESNVTLKKIKRSCAHGATRKKKARKQSTFVEKVKQVINLETSREYQSLELIPINAATEITKEIQKIMYTLDLEKNCTSPKAAKSLAYRILILVKIKDFMKSELMEQEIEFDCVLNSKQSKYVVGVATNLNKRITKNVFGSFWENELFHDIRNIAGQCFVTFSAVGKKLILQKKRYQKRFTNSALDKSAQLSINTSCNKIYINNTEVTPREDDVIDSSDSDVMIIEEKREVIVISDDEVSSTNSFLPVTPSNSDDMLTDSQNAKEADVAGVEMSADSVSFPVKNIPNDNYCKNNTAVKNMQRELDNLSETLNENRFDDSLLEFELKNDINSKTGSIASGEEKREVIVISDDESFVSPVSSTHSLLLTLRTPSNSDDILTDTENAKGSDVDSSAITIDSNTGSIVSGVQMSIDSVSLPVKNTLKDNYCKNNTAVENLQRELDNLSKNVNDNRSDDDDDLLEFKYDSLSDLSDLENEIEKRNKIESDNLELGLKNDILTEISKECSLERGIGNLDIGDTLSFNSNIIKVEKDINNCNANELGLKNDSLTVITTECQIEGEIKNLDISDNFIGLNIVKIEKDINKYNTNNSSQSQLCEVNNNIENNDKYLTLTHVKTEKDCTTDGRDSKDLSINSSKRSRSGSEGSDLSNKKYKGNCVKYVTIVPTDDVKISIDLARNVQKLISDKIDMATFLPLLECLGIKNGIIYACHSKKTYLWLQKVFTDSELDVKVVDYSYKVARYKKLKMKVNSLIDEDFKKFLVRLELYNAGLMTDAWTEVGRQVFRDYIVIQLWVDAESYDYICENNFSLFAGIDRVKFCTCLDS